MSKLDDNNHVALRSDRTVTPESVKKWHGENRALGPTLLPPTTVVQAAKTRASEFQKMLKDAVIKRNKDREDELRKVCGEELAPASEKQRKQSA